MIAAMTFTVYAEIDMPMIYGWDGDVATNFVGEPISDTWAFDPDTETYYLLDSEGKVKQEEKSFDSGEEAEKGYVELHAILPDDLKGYDVEVTISSATQSYSKTLYEVNDYKTMMEVDVGTYNIELAMISGDLKGQYPAKFDSDFVVYADSTAALIELDFRPVEVPAETVQEDISEQKATDDEADKKDEGINIFQIIVIVILVVIVIVGIIAAKKIHDNSVE